MSNSPPEAPRLAPWWIRFGHLLPEDLRERVFEPACYEWLHRELRAGRRWTSRFVPLYAALALAMTCGFNFPRVLIDQGRPTCLAKRLLWAGTGSLVCAYVILRIQYGYAT